MKVFRNENSTGWKALTFVGIALFVFLMWASMSNAATSPILGVEQQARAFQTRNWKAMWAGYAPSYKRHCPHALWLSYVKEARATFPDKISAPVFLSLNFSGNLAWMKYRWAGQLVRYDSYVRINGSWLDQWDGHC